MDKFLYQRMPYVKAVGYCMTRGMMLMGVSLVIVFPLFLAGLFLFIGAPVFALFQMEGTCPTCGTHVVFMTNKKTVKCRGCKQRYVLIG